MAINKKLLIITSLDDLKDVKKLLKNNFKITYKKNITNFEISKIISSYDAIFTNPNNSKVYFDKKLIEKAINLKVICTASTGTTHIDKKSLYNNKIKLISLKEKRKEINKITSTAEHALALTLNSLRMIFQAHNSIKKNQWNYENFIGRQVNQLNFGILGFGRLGKYYSKYVEALGANVHIYDPYKLKVKKKYKKHKNIISFVKNIDVLSIHVHYNSETHQMINKSILSKMKKDVLIVNTSRGEVINENDLIHFLNKNKNSKYSTDVLTDETKFLKSKLFKMSKNNNRQVFITPHIGGMTIDGRKIAYNKAANDLIRFFKQYEKN